MAAQLFALQLLFVGLFGGVSASQNRLQGVRQHAEGAADLGEGGFRREGLPGGYRGAAAVG